MSNNNENSRPAKDIFGSLYWLLLGFQTGIACWYWMDSLDPDSVSNASGIGPILAGRFVFYLIIIIASFFIGIIWKRVIFVLILLSMIFMGLLGLGILD